MRWPSPCGTWELRYVESGAPVNSSGYGMQGWTWELVTRATGAVIASWSGTATTSPWNASSHGIARVSWDGDTLVIEHCADHVEPEIERVLPRDLTPA